VHPSRLRVLPLCLAIAGVVHAEGHAQPPAPTWALCRVPTTLPMFVTPVPAAADSDTAPTDVEADALDLKKSQETIFSGNVQLRHSDQWLGTEKLTYTHEDERFITEGLVKYQDSGMRLTADQARGDQKADTLDLTNATYQFNQELGNGHADTVHLHENVGTLDDASYSTCPPGQRQWEFDASRITVNQDTKTGVAHNALLRLGGVPVLWLPVVSFPTDDKRRTGVLSPTIGRDDRNGFSLTLPVYLNLAPNYDATLTPHWLSKRGLMLEGEFRYLTERSKGTFTGTWLPDDDITNRDRSLLTLNHETTLNDHWTAGANLNHVSDRNYLSDFGDSIDNTSVSLLDSKAGFYGRGLYWTASLTSEVWQIANPLFLEHNAPFRRLPRLQVSAHRPLASWLDAGVDAEAVRFTHESLPGGQRVDLEPYLALSFGSSSWFVDPRLSWRYTTYQLDSDFTKLTDHNPSRSLPILSVDAGAYFERDFDWGGKAMVQTLEPRLYYLRVPYRNQDDLPLFDTRELTFGWTSLFRDNRFGGADRQSDANQLTLALTTRLMSTDDGREKLSASIGRITYFDPPQVTIPGSPPISDNGSDWVTQVDWSITDNWTVGAAQQWDPDHRQTDLSSVHSQLRLRNGTVLNAAYRYRRNSLEQTDLSFVVPVNPNWSLYGRWNFSLRDNQTIEALGGFQWKSCCVAVRLLGRQYIRSFNSRQNLGLYLEIELTGMGSFGRDTARLLDNAILGYAR
jgi:LPS-assembly protein